jgi:hypothetical protein
MIERARSEQIFPYAASRPKLNNTALSVVNALGVKVWDECVSPVR